jgi:hypothetical protein
MQTGTDIYEASKYLGMTVRTLEETYGHLAAAKPDQCPRRYRKFRDKRM